MIEAALKDRQLPDLLTMQNGQPVTEDNWQDRRQELVQILADNLYGHTPPAPSQVRVTPLGIDRYRHFGGKAVTQQYSIAFDTPSGEFSFPFSMTLPKQVEKPPVIMLLAFQPAYPIPEEEILDNGFALVRMYHHTIQPDDRHPQDYFGHFSEGLGHMYFGDRSREKNEWGKVGMWAFGASRVMDYLQTREDIDRAHIAIAGHSRNGKAALWCRAQDPRFFAAYSNNANYGGAGLIRGHTGEDCADFIKMGSFDFFSEGWKDFADTPHAELPFDQHFLVACQAPGLAYICGATKDGGMDPVSEFLSCCAASAFYQKAGKRGLVTEDRLPEIEESLSDGELGFHIREGHHFMSRSDWAHFMAFFKKHM